MESTVHCVASGAGLCACGNIHVRKKRMQVQDCLSYRGTGKDDALGKLSIHEVTPGKIELFLQRKATMLQPQSINHLRGYLSRALMAAIKVELFKGVNPTTLISISNRLAWSGRRGSNSRHSAWEADALPTELRPHASCHSRVLRQRQGERAPAGRREIKRTGRPGCLRAGGPRGWGAGVGR